MTEATSEISYREEGVPLEGIATVAGELVAMYGGSIVERAENRIRFNLPRRRGADASGGVACMLEWDEGSEGMVRLSAQHEIDASRVQRIALLVAGVVGALAFTVWPFFPGLGPVAGVGMVIAIAVYLLTLRQAPHGMIGSLLQQIVNEQDERAAREATVPPAE